MTKLIDLFCFLNVSFIIFPFICIWSSIATVIFTGWHWCCINVQYSSSVLWRTRRKLYPDSAFKFDYIVQAFGSLFYFSFLDCESIWWQILFPKQGKFVLPVDRKFWRLPRSFFAFVFSLPSYLFWVKLLVECMWN